MCNRSCPVRLMCSRQIASTLLVAVLLPPVSDALALAPSETRVDPHASALTSLGRSTMSGPLVAGKKRVAIVLRGESFRYGYKDSNGEGHRKPCAKEAIPQQMTATRSLVEKIIEPLERLGSIVEVFGNTNDARRTRVNALNKEGASTALVSACPLSRMLYDALHENSSRIVHERALVTTGQADAMRQVLDAFNKDVGGSVGMVGHRFDYILIVRHDMIWGTPIDEWRVDFDRVNALNRCEDTAGMDKGGVDCIHDTFWMFPGHLFPAFYESIGHDGCFDPAQDPEGNGHSCQHVIKDALATGGYRNAFGWIEPARRRVRSPSEIANIIADHKSLP